MLTSEYIKAKAKAYGADICGIAPIERFAGVPAQRDPKGILPNATCVLGYGFRVPKGLYYCMDKKTQYHNYTNLGVKYIDEELSEIFLLKMAALIENEGFDACVQRNVSNLKIKGDKTQNPELIDTYELQYAEPVAPGKAISAEDGSIDNWQCAAYYNGASMKNNHFMPADAFSDLPNRYEIASGEAKLSPEEAREVIDRTFFYPPIKHGYVGSICGKACDRACYVHLERKGVLTRKFEGEFRKREVWELPVELD